jgi:hypothetical protein
MTPITSTNPMDMVPLSAGTLLLQMAQAQGIAGGTLYLMGIEGGGSEQFIPQSEWAAQSFVLGPFLYLWVTFGPAPQSADWGPYHEVGELTFYLQHPEITGISGGLRALLGL